MIDQERLLNDPIYAEKVKIEKRKLDGIEMYQFSQAQMRLNRIANNINYEVYNVNVYTPMVGVINAISSGNFLDAYSAIMLVVPNPYLTSATLLSFKNTIATYILGDGDYSDFAGKTLNPLTGLIS